MLDARIGRLLGSLAYIIAAGTLGFVVIEGVYWFDALYMTAITLTTVGFNEVWELSRGGRAWSMLLMFTGIGIFFYIAGQIALQAVDFKRIRRYRMKQRIERIKDHYVICGYGRMGSAIAEEFNQNDTPFVVIENDLDLIEELQTRDFLFIEGSATEDENLLSAGIERAVGLIGVLREDQDNLLLTISARNLNKQLYIITRANTQRNNPKLRQVGADKVINPYREAGIKMARQAVAPSVVDFLDVVLSRKNVDLNLESLEIKPGSEAEGKTMVDLEVRKSFNIIIAAIEQKDGTALVNPDPSYRLNAGDHLIALGNVANLRAFAELCSVS